MDLTIGQPGGEFWKRIKLRNVIAVTGILLAAVLAWTGSEKSRSEPAESTALPPQANPVVRDVSRYTPRSLILYVVSTSSAKEALEQDLMYLQWPLQGPAAASVGVVVIGRDEEESFDELAELATEAETTVGHGANLTLIDLR
jgi:hypothetical protein